LVEVHAAFEEYGAEPGHAVDDLLIEGDGIHPNAAGHRLVGRCWRQPSPASSNSFATLLASGGGKLGALWTPSHTGSV
jgi:hypothetical protein